MPRNALLSGMPEKTLKSVLQHASIVRLKRRQMLEGPMVQRTQVFFPESGVITSEAGVGPGRSRLGGGLVGRRGLVGLSSLLNVPSSPLVAVVIDPGESIAVPISAIEELMRSEPAFSEQMNRYLHSRLVLLAQINFCNASHSVEERIARWLLVGSHSIDSDELCVTHSDVASLLGVRRPSVSVGIGRLRDQGAITLDRRCVRIADRTILQKQACACHRHMIAEMEKGLSPPQRSPNHVSSSRGASLG